MRDNKPVMAFCQSEKIKSGIIWVSQSVQLLLGLHEPERSGGERMVKVLLEMVLSEVSLAETLVGAEEWEAARGHLERAAVMSPSGTIDADLARELSLTGVAARATGLILDARVHRQGYTPPAPWAMLGVRPATDERGDVAARAAVRFVEIFESLRLLRELAVGLPDSELRIEVPPMPGGSGLGVIEGWRGRCLFLPEQVLDELKRVVTADGVLVVSTPNRRAASPGNRPGDRPRNKFHVREFDRHELRAALSLRFADVVNRDDVRMGEAAGRSGLAGALGQ